MVVMSAELISEQDGRILTLGWVRTDRDKQTPARHQLVLFLPCF